MEFLTIHDLIRDESPYGRRLHIQGQALISQNSPLSLNYIITTAVTNSGIKKRFVTQIGYSFIALGATVLFGYLLFALNLKPYVSIASGFLVIALLLMFLSKDIEIQ
jgi:hypothetical protein